jgi:hypothetical protein
VASEAGFPFYVLCDRGGKWVGQWFIKWGMFRGVVCLRIVHLQFLCTKTVYVKTFPRI